MSGTRDDLYRVMGPYICKAARLTDNGVVQIGELDYGFTITVQFGNRVIWASIHYWDDEYASEAFKAACSPAGGGRLTWLTREPA